MHLVISTHLYFFWVVSHLSRTLPPKESEQEPQNRFSLLPTARPYHFLPLTNDPPLLYWLGTGWWCIGLTRALVLCTTKACPLLMHLPWFGGSSVHSATHPWPLMTWTILLVSHSLRLASFFKGWALFDRGLSLISLLFGPSIVLLPFLLVVEV